MIDMLEREILTPAIGAIIHGIDLADEAALARHADALRHALLEHQVVFFRDQQLDPDAQVRVAAVFGSVKDVSSTFVCHPENARVEVLESHGHGPGTDVWHADLSWQPAPPIGACLYAVDVPAAGGDTMWASMTAAYDSLAPELRTYIDGLTAVHNWEGPEIVGNVRKNADGDARYRALREKYPPLEVPVVTTHPETRKRVLSVNALYTTSICGVAREQSAALLARSRASRASPNGKYAFTGTPVRSPSGITAPSSIMPCTATTRRIA